MKKFTKFLAILVLAAASLIPSASAQLNVPSDGSDGILNITNNAVIDLSQATTGVWTSNNAANAGNGIYDNTQWAVVFKYSSINIGPNATNVTFLNHPTHAPVVWLVQSNVTINGIVNLNGQPAQTSAPQIYTPTEPGPGGFRGGANGPVGAGAGFGPGGAQPGSGNGYDGDGADASYIGVYGNPQVLPLIGGSGSGAYNGASGSGAGGAILIVAGGTVTVNGQITALGGTGNVNLGISGVIGASGAIRIVANQILGNGTIDAGSQLGAFNDEEPATGGRTRMEANTLSPQLTIFPNTEAVPPGTTPVIFPPANAPTVSVLSVGTQTAPLDPQAAVASSADIGIQTNGPVTITLQTENFPIEGAVGLRITPKYGSALGLTASYVSGNINQATWQVTSTLPQGFCVLQARATAP